MSRPIIAVTSGRRKRAVRAHDVQNVIMGCPIEYLAALEQAGAAAVMLPSVLGADSTRVILAMADGVLLSGGGDILSLHYGEEPHPLGAHQEPIRDVMELALTRIALEMGLPILGVCRGLQLLNVAFGGTLLQDIPSQVPGAVQHVARGMDTVLQHTIAIEPDSILARVVGATTLPVNSWHHQAVKELGAGLRVTARARDGVVEAVESADDRPLLSVQFHPEECQDTYPPFRAIFAWLVTEAQAFRQRREIAIARR